MCVILVREEKWVKKNRVSQVKPTPKPAEPRVTPPPSSQIIEGQTIYPIRQKMESIWTFWERGQWQRTTRKERHESMCASSLSDKQCHASSVTLRLTVLVVEARPTAMVQTKIFFFFNYWMDYHEIWCRYSWINLLMLWHREQSSGQNSSNFVLISKLTPPNSVQQ